MCIETNEVFDTIKEGANKYNTQAQAISQMLDGKRKTAAGLHWVRLDKRRTRRKLMDELMVEEILFYSDYAENENV